MESGKRRTRASVGAGYSSSVWETRMNKFDPPKPNPKPNLKLKLKGGGGGVTARGINGGEEEEEEEEEEDVISCDDQLQVPDPGLPIPIRQPPATATATAGKPRRTWRNSLKSKSLPLHKTTCIINNNNYNNNNNNNCDSNNNHSNSDDNDIGGGSPGSSVDGGSPNQSGGKKKKKKKTISSSSSSPPPSLAIIQLKKKTRSEEPLKSGSADSSHNHLLNSSPLTLTLTQLRRDQVESQPVVVVVVDANSTTAQFTNYSNSQTQDSTCGTHTHTHTHGDDSATSTVEEEEFNHPINSGSVTNLTNSDQEQINGHDEQALILVNKQVNASSDLVFKPITSAAVKEDVEEALLSTSTYPAVERNHTQDQEQEEEAEPFQVDVCEQQFQVHQVKVITSDPIHDEDNVDDGHADLEEDFFGSGDKDEEDIDTVQINKYKSLNSVREMNAPKIRTTRVVTPPPPPPPPVNKSNQVSSKKSSTIASKVPYTRPLPSLKKQTQNSPTPTLPHCKVSDDFCRTQESHGNLQSLVDLVMWRDVSKSAFVFGVGTFMILSSSYTKDLNISLISVASYISLLYLAVVFLYRSIICRGVVDERDSLKNEVLGEEEAIWLVKLVLPYLNEFLFKLTALFSGDPVVTMKLALMLFVLARCGNYITIWKMVKLGFLGVFVIPKVCSSYSTHITAYAKFWIQRFQDAWKSCAHKKALAFAIFTLVWNFSSIVARAWAAFMLFVAFRYYQRSMITDDWVEDQTRLHDQQQGYKGRHSRRVLTSIDRKKEKKGF